jgi:hypothetical protein
MLDQVGHTLLLMKLLVRNGAAIDLANYSLTTACEHGQLDIA